MMARNGTSTKFESNHLQYEGNIVPLKEGRPDLSKRSPAFRGNVSSVCSSAQDTVGRIMISTNGQHFAQTVSISIDDVADSVEKPEIANEGRHANDAMNEIGQEDEGNANVVERDPSPLAKHDFLVSFLVDARGGSMYGCRNSGIKVP